jgi:hypothetical protein
MRLCRRFSLAVAAVVVAAPLVLIGPAGALDGGLDLSFGTAGVVTLPAFGSVLALADGRIVATIPSDALASSVERLLPDGTVDGSFGVGGRVASGLPRAPGQPMSPTAERLAETSSGRLIVRGRLGGSPVWFQLNADGSRDTGFGQDGYVQSGAGGFLGPIIVRPEGDALAWPSSPGKAGATPLRAIQVSLAARGRPSRDSDWGPDLLSVVPDAYGVSQVHLGDDGRMLVLVGRFAPLDSGGVSINGCSLIAVNSDGTVDVSFGAGGAVAIVAASVRDRTDCSMAAFADGSSAVALSGTVNGICRYTRSGAVASSGGVPGSPLALAALGDGRLAVLLRTFEQIPQLQIVALTSQNVVDQNFGTTGFVSLGRDGYGTLITRPGGGLLASIWVGTVRTDLVAVDTNAGAPSEPALVQTSRYEPVAPERILDTRSGLGAPAAKVIAGRTIEVQVAGQGGVPPAGATAVVLNVTAANVGGAGYVTVWPTGQSQPNASNLNVEDVGQTAPNLVTVPIGSGGRVSMFTSTTADLIADIAGYFVPAVSARGGRFVAASTPQRVLDTRGGPGHAGAVGKGQSIDVNITGVAEIPVSGISAVVVNVTATNAQSAGYVTVWPTGTVMPVVSNLNLDGRGSTRPNLAVVRLGTSGRLSMFDDAGSDLIVDVVGWFTDDSGPTSAAGLFVPARPRRLLDTRLEAGPIPANSTARLYVAGAATVPPRSSAAVIMNLTATAATDAGFVTAFPARLALPTASTLNIEHPGQTIANLAVVRLNGRATDFYTQSGTHLIADLAGWFTAGSPDESSRVP